MMIITMPAANSYTELGCIESRACIKFSMQMLPTTGNSPYHATHGLRIHSYERMLDHGKPFSKFLHPFSFVLIFSILILQCSIKNVKLLIFASRLLQ